MYMAPLDGGGVGGAGVDELLQPAASMAATAAAAANPGGVKMRSDGIFLIPHLMQHRIGGLFTGAESRTRRWLVKLM
jgi:hypothetical protein